MGRLKFKSGTKMARPLKTDKLGEMIERVEADWNKARSERPDENAMSFGFEQYGKHWLMALKLASGLSFSHEASSYKELLVFLADCSEHVRSDTVDYFALADIIKQFAIKLGDPETLRIVRESFGLDLVGKPL